MTNNENKNKRFNDKIKEIYGDDIELLTEYINQKTKIDYRCVIHNTINSSYPNNLSRGHNGCPMCRSEKLRKANLKTHEEFDEQVKKINPHIKLIDKYTGSGKNLRCFCTVHNKEFTKYFSRLINCKTGCDECYTEDIRERMGKTTDQFKSELQEVHPELEVIGEYINRNTPIKLKCKTHNYEFNMRPCDILKRSSCCPKSIKFVKEEEIMNLLDKWHISYNTQKTFYDCKDKRTLPFDFYLTDYNILIEYQGQQHYYPVKFGTQIEEEAIKKFDYTKNHDLIKSSYCIKNSITLIEIPYWEYSNLENFLFSKLILYNVIKTIN